MRELGSVLEPSGHVASERFKVGSLDHSFLLSTHEFVNINLDRVLPLSFAQKTVTTIYHEQQTGKHHS